MGKGKDGASRVPWRVRSPAWRAGLQNLVPEARGRAAGRAGLPMARVPAGRSPTARPRDSPARGWTGCHLRRGGAKEVGSSPEESLEEMLGGEQHVSSIDEEDTGDQMGHRGDSKESQGHTAGESRQIWGPGGHLGNLKPPC